VLEALALIDKAGGEVWAKLDAGTPDYFKLIGVPPSPTSASCATSAIWALRSRWSSRADFMRVHGIGPSDAEITACIGRLQQFQADGARLKLVQVYSVSRPPAESYVTALPPEELETLRSRMEAALGCVPVRRFVGTWTGVSS
jgi:hypothetical protein